MKGFALCLTGLALLATGCAQNRGSEPEIAPSRQASRLISGSGWSVPPGQHRVTGRAAVQEPAQDDRAVGARSENTRKDAAPPRQTVSRDENFSRGEKQTAKTMRREADPGRDPSNPRTAERLTPAAPVTGSGRQPEPGDYTLLTAGKDEAAEGPAYPRRVERPPLPGKIAERDAERDAEIGAKGGPARTVPAGVRPQVNSVRERPAFESKPDPRFGPRFPEREKVVGPTRPGRMNTGRNLRESVARSDGLSRQTVKVDGPSRRPGTMAPSIRRIKLLVPAIPIRALSKEAQPLRTVRFGFDSDKLGAEAERVLDANARWLLEHPKTMVRVEGHADERGTSEYNLTLGARRARKVRDFLISRGVSPENVLTVSFGEELPLDTGSEPKSWAQNRRTEFSLINGGNLAAMTSGPKVRRSVR